MNSYPETLKALQTTLRHSFRSSLLTLSLYVPFWLVYCGLRFVSAGWESIDNQGQFVHRWMAVVWPGFFFFAALVVNSIGPFNWPLRGFRLFATLLFLGGCEQLQRFIEFPSRGDSTIVTGGEPLSDTIPSGALLSSNTQVLSLQLTIVSIFVGMLSGLTINVLRGRAWRFGLLDLILWFAIASVFMWYTREVLLFFRQEMRP